MEQEEDFVFLFIFLKASIICNSLSILVFFLISLVISLRQTKELPILNPLININYY